MWQFLISLDVVGFFSCVQLQCMFWNGRKVRCCILMKICLLVVVLKWIFECLFVYLVQSMCGFVFSCRCVIENGGKIRLLLLLICRCVVLLLLLKCWWIMQMVMKFGDCLKVWRWCFLFKDGVIVLLQVSCVGWFSWKQVWFWVLSW